MSTSRRETNKAKCRARILKASRDLFSNKGYEETLIDEVAEKAEISKGTLYNYFPNKESLLVGISEDEILRAQSYLEKELKNEANSLERLRKVLTFLCLESIQYPNLARKITYLNAAQSSPLFAAHMELDQLVYRLVLEAQQDGYFREDANPTEITDAVLSIHLLVEYQWQYLTDYSKDYCSEKISRFFDLFTIAFISPAESDSI